MNGIYSNDIRLVTQTVALCHVSQTTVIISNCGRNYVILQEIYSYHENTNEAYKKISS